MCVFVVLTRKCVLARKCIFDEKCDFGRKMRFWRKMCFVVLTAFCGSGGKMRFYDFVILVSEKMILGLSL